MELETLIQIKEPGSTSTHNESGSPEPKSTHQEPPEHLRLKVVMLAPTGSPVRLTVVGTDVSAEGKTVPEAFRNLIEVARHYLKSIGGEKAKLRHYKPYTWFRFMSPGQTSSADRFAFADGFMSALNVLYEFKGDSVTGFIEENPSLGGLLFIAREVIRKYFGPEVEVALEVVADPEALGDKQLFILIRTELPRKVARQRLAELDRAWWLNELPRAEGKLEIALE